MEIAIGNSDQIAQANLLAGTAMMNTHGFAASVEMMMIRFELSLESVGRGVLAMRFG